MACTVCHTRFFLSSKNCKPLPKQMMLVIHGCHDLGCQLDEPLASLVTTNRIINVYGCLVVIMLFTDSVLHFLYSVGNKITPTTCAYSLPKGIVILAWENLYWSNPMQSYDGLSLKVLSRFTRWCSFVVKHIMHHWTDYYSGDTKYSREINEIFGNPAHCWNGTHWGLVMPYGNKDLIQHWLR